MPAISLANSFSYAKKLLLVSTIFSLPLLFIVTAKIVHFREESIALKNKIALIEFLIESHEILKNVAYIREIRFLKGMGAYEQESNDEKRVIDKTIAIVNRLAAHHIIQENRIYQFYLERLKLELTKNYSSFGTEADNIETLFNFYSEPENIINRINATLLMKAGIYNEPDIFPAIAVSILINELPESLTNMNKLESYRMVFITKNFLDSNSVILLTHLLEAQKIKYENMSIQLKSIYETQNPHAFKFDINLDLLNSIPENIKLIEDSLLFNLDAPTSNSRYRNNISDEASKLYELRGRLLVGLYHFYKNRISIANKQSIIQIALMIGSILLAAYVFFGIIFGVNKSLTTLVVFAKKLEDGHLDSPLTFYTKDEFNILANALEDMRSELSMREKELLKLTITDGLTGVFNRKHFDDVFKSMAFTSARVSTPLSILLIDIDHFKQINDRYGHQAGDECLIHFANILKSTLTRATDYVFRYGGEEFAALLPHTDNQGAIIFANKMLDNIRSSSLTYKGEAEIKFTASIGIASIDQCSRSFNPDDLISAADAALYEAKTNGRNQAIIGNGVVCND